MQSSTTPTSVRFWTHYTSKQTMEQTKELTLNEYQRRAMSTRMKTCDDVYMLLNLAGEVGELTSKVAKQIRKGNTKINENGLIRYDLGENYETFEQELRKEAGDVLWQLAGFCSVMGWPLNDVGQENLDKLSSRAERGVIDGEGDNR